MIISTIPKIIDDSNRRKIPFIKIFFSFTWGAWIDCILYYWVQWNRVLFSQLIHSTKTIILSTIVLCYAVYTHCEFRTTGLLKCAYKDLPWFQSLSYPQFFACIANCTTCKMYTVSCRSLRLVGLFQNIFFLLRACASFNILIICLLKLYGICKKRYSVDTIPENQKNIPTLCIVHRSIRVEWFSIVAETVNWLFKYVHDEYVRRPRLIKYIYFQ